MLWWLQWLALFVVAPFEIVHLGMASVTPRTIMP